VTGLLVVWAGARSSRPQLAAAQRAVGIALTGTLVLGMVAGGALFAWSVDLWDAALTWPPMIVGMVVAGAAYFSLTRAARGWVRATAR